MDFQGGVWTHRYKVFPPRWRNQWIPTSSKAAGLAGLCTYSAVRPLGRTVQRASLWAVSMFGAGILPGRTHSLALPVPVDVMTELFAIIQTEVVKFDELSVHRHRGEDRTGFAVLLLQAGIPQAFVKFRETDQATNLIHEEEALQLVVHSQPRTFSSPAVIGSGEFSGWRFLALEPLPPLMHKTPKRPPIAEIADEIQTALRTLHKPSSMADHWAPMHGDLTPWNLRMVRSSLSLFDWENVGWGPPGSDLTLYHLTSRQLGLRTSPGLMVDQEAYNFWVEQGRVDPTRASHYQNQAVRRDQ